MESYLIFLDMSKKQAQYFFIESGYGARFNVFRSHSEAGTNINKNTSKHINLK